MRRIIVGILASALFIPAGVRADTRSNDIPQEREASGPLGIDSWKTSHLDGGIVRHTIAFTGEWDNSLLARDDDGEFGSIELRFKVWGRNGNVKNRLARLAVNPDGSLDVPITDARVSREFGEPSWSAVPPTWGHMNAWRPDARTLQVEFHPRALNQKKWPYNVYRWAAASGYVDNREGSEGCRSFEQQEDGSIVVIDPAGCGDRTFFIKHDLRR